MLEHEVSYGFGFFWSEKEDSLGREKTNGCRKKWMGKECESGKRGPPDEENRSMLSMLEAQNER